MNAAAPITTMVVGLGRIGWEYHCKQAAANPGFTVTAAVDPLPERRREAEALCGCRTFATIEEGLRAGLAELAVIATRSSDHVAHALQALEAGCHVVVEKPAAPGVRDLDRMIEAAAARGRVLTVNQSDRASKDLRFVRETIDSGLLGDVFWIRLSAQSFFRRNDWQMLKRYGGGFLGNNGVHAVDSLLRLADSPVHDVWGDLKHVVTAGDADDWLKIIIRTERGRVLEIEQSYACAFPGPRWLVCGATGTMTATDAKASLKFFDPRAAAPITVIDAAPEGRRYGNADALPWQERVVDMEPARPYPDFYQSLARSIREGAEPLVTMASVRATMAVLDAVREKSMWR
jgi:scyllo-inositol 2-dehydrogenase (NADP+)